MTFLNRSVRRRASLLPLAVGVSVALMAAPAHAQRSAPATVIRGEIIDAATGAGLSGASVRLIREASEEPDPERPVVTDAAGGYRFEGVEPGRYVLRVERLGYRSAELRVTVRGRGEARVSVGLDVDPIPLEPVEVSSTAGAPYDRAVSRSMGAVPAVRLRQRRYLATDVRGLTHGELLESVTMGESDLFRALHRLPSVSTRDDWSAELWTRNAAWDQTRVTLDGLPLFSPLHGAGVFGAVNPDALGAVYLHPGVRPARFGAGGAGVLELWTRPASAREIQGFGELSLASGRLAVDRQTPSGGWMVAGRRTYLDWLTRGVEAGLDLRDASIPYHYSDLTARVERAVSNSAKLEASGTWILDRLTGNVPDVLHASQATWGNRLGRITLSHELAGLRARQTLGVTAYHAALDTTPPDPALDHLSAPRVEPLDHGLTHIVLRGELEPRTPPAGEAGPGGAVRASAGWNAGYELVHQAARAVGAPPSPFLDADITALDSLDLHRRLIHLATWYERRWWAGPVELTAGLRVEAGPGMADSGPLRPAPRLQLRWEASQALVLGAGAGRSYQYAQSPLAVGLPLGVSRTPLFPAGAFWMLAGDSVPALRSDVVTVGGELWLGRQHLVSVTGYARSADGVLVPDPRPGLATDRPLYVVADERARGVEVSVRRLAGRLTGSASYALARATQHALGLDYASPSDRRHTVDLTGGYQLAAGLVAGGAFTYATGSPYTRILAAQPDPTDPSTTLVRGEPGARRMPTYAALDLSLEWMKSFRSWGLGAFLQIRNALNRTNAASYGDSSIRCPDDSTGNTRRDGVTICEPSGRPPSLHDEFLPAMPRAPLLGLRLRF